MLVEARIVADNLYELAGVDGGGEERMLCRSAGS